TACSIRRPTWRLSRSCGGATSSLRQAPARPSTSSDWPEPPAAREERMPMTDLKVGAVDVANFAAALDQHAGVVGAECYATGQLLGSGMVQDALGNVSLVLTVLDQALAAGAGALARDARASGDAWSAADSRMS